MILGSRGCLGTDSEIYLVPAEKRSRRIGRASERASARLKYSRDLRQPDTGSRECPINVNVNAENCVCLL